MTEQLPAIPQDLPPAEPFKVFTLKAVENCNMGCLCYEYLGDNESLRTRQSIMPIEIVEQAAIRFGEHVAKHNLDSISVFLHGGEPLLLGAKGLQDVVTTIQKNVSCPVRFGMQTNGLLLDEKDKNKKNENKKGEEEPTILDVLKLNDFRIGISLDGDRAANDRFRLDQSGRSTHDRAVRAINVLRKTDLKWGLLALIDIENKPLDVYKALQSYSPPLGMDFLFPLANWDNPPPHRDSSRHPYADWFISIYDTYMDSPNPAPVRKIDSIVNVILGGATMTETLSNPAPRQIFIRKDGAYEDVDTLLSVSAQAPSLGMNVKTHSLDEVAEHPWMKFRRMGRTALPDTCQRCKFVPDCGGGYISHRYSREKGFNNPSVYCDDLVELFSHIHADIRKRRGM